MHQRRRPLYSEQSSGKNEIVNAYDMTRLGFKLGTLYQTGRNQNEIIPIKSIAELLKLI
jgi:hypothetical protein